MLKNLLCIVCKIYLNVEWCQLQLLACHDFSARASLGGVASRRVASSPGPAGRRPQVQADVSAADRCWLGIRTAPPRPNMWPRPVILLVILAAGVLANGECAVPAAPAGTRPLSD
ncbi:uncharacterized protein LOC117651176 [Thrips palmi]|uniref:Uncharacterized protein LOC117651176 n=1 Tax=Thrips palmi TaxID=161013 RepID=A0A6P9A0K7_THRPL|nr:uncharacterized protein LOC117651176 [Thrips palmi]